MRLQQAQVKTTGSKLELLSLNLRVLRLVHSKINYLKSISNLVQIEFLTLRTFRALGRGL